MTQLALRRPSAVVAAVRAVVLVLTTRSGAHVGRCRCGRMTLYVSARQGWFRCFSCGLGGCAENARERLAAEPLDGSAL